MKVKVESVPHGEQRYPTVGDWFDDKDGVLVIRVSDTGDWRYDALVAIHELVEAVLCRNDGVTEQAVTDFDVRFETLRQAGDTREPGAQPDAPYRKQHMAAEYIEQCVARVMGVNWQKYEQALEALDAPDHELV